MRLNAQFASKFTEKAIAKNQRSSLAAIKPVTAACPLFSRNPVLLAALTLLTTKSSSFSLPSKIILILLKFYSDLLSSRIYKIKQKISPILVSACLASTTSQGPVYCKGEDYFCFISKRTIYSFMLLLIWNIYF
jgi:hypothetical protein